MFNLAISFSWVDSFLCEICLVPKTDKEITKFNRKYRVFQGFGMSSNVNNFLIFDFQRPCRYFLVTKTWRPRYYHITMAQVFNFLCWDSEKLPPVFSKLGPQPNVSDGSLLSREATKLLVTSLSFSWHWALILLFSAKIMPHR